MYTLKESIKMGGCWFYPIVTYRGNEIADDRKLADAYALKVDVTDEFSSRAPIEVIEMQDYERWEYVYTVNGEVEVEGSVPWEFVGWEPALRWICDKLFDWYF